MELSQHPEPAGEEKVDDRSKPVNGTTEAASKSQPGTNKKVDEMKTEVNLVWLLPVLMFPHVSSALALQTPVPFQGQAGHRQGPNPSRTYRPGRASLQQRRRDWRPPGAEQRWSFALWSQGPSLWSLHASVIPAPQLSRVSYYLEASDQRVRRFLSRGCPPEVSCERTFIIIKATPTCKPKMCFAGLSARYLHFTRTLLVKHF